MNRDRVPKIGSQVPASIYTVNGWGKIYLVTVIGITDIECTLRLDGNSVKPKGVSQEVTIKINDVSFYPQK